MRRALLALGVVAAPVFLVTALVEGGTRPGYDPWSQPVSALSLGPRGWRQRANFLVTGAAMVGCGVGLAGSRPSSRWGARLVAGFGAGLIGAGFFDTDPVRGYDPECRFGRITAAGVVHQTSAVPVFVGLPVAAFAYGRAFGRAGSPGWAAASVAAGIAMPIGAAVFGQGFGLANASPDRPAIVRRAGLAQRATISIGWTWVAAVALHALRSE